MPTISDVYEAFSALNIRAKLPEFIKETEYPLMLKIQQQHEGGFLSTGSKIIPSYKSKYYSKFKASLNPAPGYGTADIKVTGAYNADMHITIDGSNFTIDSEVDYATSASILQYGNELNLPSDQSKQEYWAEQLVPAILDYVHEETGL